MDQCSYCTVKDDLQKCLKTECSVHERWLVKELMKKAYPKCDGERCTGIPSAESFYKEANDKEETSL